MNTTTVAKKANQVMGYLSSMAMIATTIMYAYPAVFATSGSGKAGTAGEEVIGGVLSVVFLITNIVGIIFIIVGFVKLVIAHAQEDGPAQQKAALFIATGLVLILVRIVMDNIGFKSWINTDAAENKGSGGGT